MQKLLSKADNKTIIKKNTVSKKKNILILKVCHVSDKVQV